MNNSLATDLLLLLSGGASPTFEQQILALDPEAFWYAGDGESIPAAMNGAADGGAVTTWNDLGSTGSHLSQSTASAKPTYHQSGATFNNRGYVSFDGGDVLFRAVASGLIEPTFATWNLFIVYSTVSSNTNRSLYAEASTTDAIPLNLLNAGVTSADRVRYSPRVKTGASPAIESAPLGFNDGSAHIITLRRIGAGSFSLRFDGVEVGTSSNTPLTIPCDRIALGAIQQAAASNHFTGNLACGIVIQNDTNYAVAEALLAEHYNI